MAAHKRGTGYQANFTVAKKRYIQHFATEQEAKDYEADVKRAIKRGLELPKTVINVGGGDSGTINNTVRTAIAEHWGKQKGGEKQIINAKVFLRWVGTETPIKEALSYGKINEFLDYLRHDRDRHCGDKTLNRYMAMMSILIQTAGIKYTAPKTIHNKVDKLPRFKEGKGRLRFFSDEEFTSVVNLLSHRGKLRERDFFIFLVATGFRPWAEAFTLNWNEINGRKAMVLEEHSKNGESRVIPLSDQAMDAVKRQKHLKLDGPWHGMNKWTLTELWNDVRAAIPELHDTVWYTCRHTCASKQVIKGVDLFRVSKWLGHKNISQTQGYAHLADDHMAEGLIAMDSFTVPKLSVVR